jgi:hypothetical protein
LERVNPLTKFVGYEMSIQAILTVLPAVKPHLNEKFKNWTSSIFKPIGQLNFTDNKRQS